MRRLTRIAAVAALAAAPLLATAQPASAACVAHGDPGTVAADVCFVLRPSYLRCDVYVAGQLHDCWDVVDRLN